MLTVTNTVTAKTTEEVTIKPTLRRKLLVELAQCQKLRAEMKALEAQLDKHKGKIEELRDETGYQSVSLEGFTVSLVAPLRSTLDKQRLIAQGVTMAQIENATVVKPTKPYTKITYPNEPDKGYAGE